MKRILEWFESRLNLRDTVGADADSPDSPRRRWSDGLVVCFRQCFDDVALDPGAHRNRVGPRLCSVHERSLCKLGLFEEHQPLGWFLRSLHYWSGSAMVIMVAVHMTQVFLHGAFKIPAN